MARTLRRLNQWHGLAAPKDNPITHAELRAGALSPASIDRIRAIFEAMIERGARTGPKWLTPETGGEATLDTELRLVEALGGGRPLTDDEHRAVDDVRELERGGRGQDRRRQQQHLLPLIAQRRSQGAPEVIEIPLGIGEQDNFQNMASRG